MDTIVRCEMRILRKGGGGIIWKTKWIDLKQTNSKNKNIRDLYRDRKEFKKGYQPRTKMTEEKL
jgi:hypothetical protein